MVNIPWIITAPENDVTTELLWNDLTAKKGTVYVDPKRSQAFIQNFLDIAEETANPFGCYCNNVNIPYSLQNQWEESAQNWKVKQFTNSLKKFIDNHFPYRWNYNFFSLQELKNLLTTFNKFSEQEIQTLNPYIPVDVKMLQTIWMINENQNEFHQNTKNWLKNTLNLVLDSLETRNQHCKIINKNSSIVVLNPTMDIPLYEFFRNMINFYSNKLFKQFTWSQPNYSFLSKNQQDWTFIIKWSVEKYLQNYEHQFFDITCTYNPNTDEIIIQKTDRKTQETTTETKKLQYEET